MKSSHCLSSQIFPGRLVPSASAFIVWAVSVSANVSTIMFQSNMVLQQEMTVPVFGNASSGESVTVTFRGQSRSAKAESNGSWRVDLDPMETGGPFEMTIEGKNTLTLSNVMVGEVWMCAGQSNMAIGMNQLGGANKEEASKANYPNVRILKMPSKWTAMTSSAAGDAPALPYYFGKELNTSLNVPVGLIVGAKGGTEIEKWMPNGECYNKYIKPVVPFAIRGIVWYQGETDARWDANVKTYKSFFFDLIPTYRKDWGQGDIPFFYAQIASKGSPQIDPNAASRFAQIRDIQTEALSLPNTAMAVTIDIGASGWHPVNKWDAGKRLSLLPRYLVYNIKEDSALSGPLINSCKLEGSEVHIHFLHAYGGLVDKDNKDLNGFALAGSDNKWYWARGVIREDTVILTCHQVKTPVRVRYAWADYPIATPLYNGAGLPAVPFQSDIPKEGIVAIGRVPGPVIGSRLPITSVTSTPYFDALGRLQSPPAPGSSPTRTWVVQYK